MKKLDKVRIGRKKYKEFTGIFRLNKDITHFVFQLLREKREYISIKTIEDEVKRETEFHDLLDKRVRFRIVKVHSGSK